MAAGGRVLVIDVPEHNDEEWLKNRLRDLNSRLEDLVFDEPDSARFRMLGECLDIVNALQEYAGD